MTRRYSGFFGIRRSTWSRLAEQFGLPFQSERAFRQEVQQRVLARLAESGVTGGGALSIAGDVYDGIEAVQVWRSVANDVEQAWVEASPELTDRAVAGGYLSAGGLRDAEQQALIRGQLAGAGP